MKIFFACTTAEFFKYQETYFDIRKILIDGGNVLTRDWLPITLKKLKNNQRVADVKKIYKDCVEAIREADAVIIEDTVSNFSTGHQITLALQYRKPVLVLWQGNKHRQFEQMFIHGIESDRLQVVEYKSEELKKIINTFIEKYSGSDEKNRFHLVLNSLERRYLDWRQFNKNKSRTTIIREALKKQIDNDKEFNDYLLGNL
ncbi:MAG TPA: hypothetical protein PK370_02520 [Candidatus Woesebacteria bacterium]|nr:hypothetical protein [Candidatus Woesebacteria bacterium]HPJ16678.1 hypothetical protein [Candidatus Woesebacteria bacterium]